MKKLTKQEIEAYKKFSELCKKLESMPTNESIIIKLKTKQR